MIFNSFQLTKKFLIGLPPHASRVTRIVVDDGKLAGNFINAACRPIDWTFILAVVDEFAAFTTTETASVLVELTDAAPTTKARIEI